MKIIRIGLFETNSSSSHSVSIGMRKPKEITNDIPRNSDRPFEIAEYFTADGDESETVINTIMSENYKTSFIFAVILERLGCLYDGLEDERTGIANLCGVDPNVLKEIESENDLRNAYKTLLTENLIYTQWLKDVVYEETGTKITFKTPNTRDWFPYMRTPYNSSYADPDDEFYYELMSTLENNDEVKFKSLAREIIFNKEIIIVDKDEAYCSHIENKIL